MNDYIYNDGGQVIQKIPVNILLQIANTPTIQIFQENRAYLEQPIKDFIEAVIGGYEMNVSMNIGKYQNSFVSGDAHSITSKLIFVNQAQGQTITDLEYDLFKTYMEHIILKYIPDGEAERRLGAVCDYMHSYELLQRYPITNLIIKNYSDRQQHGINDPNGAINNLLTNIAAGGAAVGILAGAVALGAAAIPVLAGLGNDIVNAGLEVPEILPSAIDFSAGRINLPNAPSWLTQIGANGKKDIPANSVAINAPAAPVPAATLDDSPAWYVLPLIGLGIIIKLL